MNELNEQSAKASPGGPNKFNILKSKRFLLALSFIIIVSGVLWYIYHRQSVAPTYTYKYEKSSSYYFTGNGPSYGIIINRPEAYNQALPKAKIDKNNIALEQTKVIQINGKKYSYSMASFALKSRPYPNPILGTTNYRDTIAKVLNNSSAERYRESTANIQTFANQIQVYPGDVKLSSAKPYKSNNLTKYAWQFDVTADISGDEPTQKGKVLYILGDNGWYYILVTAEEHNWQNNQTFFQGILNSVKIDV